MQISTDAICNPTVSNIIKWERFLLNSSNLGHFSRNANNINLRTYIQDCWSSSQQVASQVKKEIPKHAKPKKILEVGCSVGLNCFALQDQFPDAEILGIDPETIAIDVARSMSSDFDPPSAVSFLVGYVESLSLPSNFFDIVVCNTVIEHVSSVEEAINEISRVLAPGGILYLEAPNYIFPFEPHLEIITIPLLGKNFMRFCAYIQGKEDKAGFLGHLQLVTPYQLEKLFAKYNLTFVDRSLIKMQEAAKGMATVKKYFLLAKVLKALHYLGISKPLIAALHKIGLYPSLLYTVRKQEFGYDYALDH